MTAIEVPSPLPPAARKEQVSAFLADIERSRRSATAANLLLKHEGDLARPAAAQLVAILAELEASLASLENRRAVIMPGVKHPADNLDAVYDAAYDAGEYIYKLEALLHAMRRQLNEQPDGHVITLCELAVEQMPKLRFALYGERMGP